MKKLINIIVIFLFVLLVVFNLNTTNLSANTYRNFQLDFYEEDSYVRLVVDHLNDDIEIMNLYRDDEFYLELEVVNNKEYILKNFVKNKVYEFYILYKIKNDNNYYKSMLHTLSCSKDIASDFNDNDRIGIDLPDGVVEISYFRFENNRNIYKLKYISSEEFDNSEYLIDFEEFPFHVQFLLNQKFHNMFTISDNTFLIPELELKTINISKENHLLVKKENKEFMNYDLYLKFKSNSSFIKEIKIFYEEKGFVFNKKKEIILKPDKINFIENFGFLYNWSNISSDHFMYDIKIPFKLKKHNEYEITDIVINYNHIKVFYDEIDYNNSYLPSDKADQNEKGILIDSIKVIDFKSFFQDLFKINSLSNFLSFIYRYFKELIILIFVILFLPLIVKLISIILDLFKMLISIFLPRKLRSR